MKEKNILLTGISTGLGFAVAQKLLTENYSVFGVSRKSSDKLEDLQQKYSDRLFILHTDLADPEGARHALFDKFISLDTPLYGFVNNAAIAYDDIITNLQISPLEEMYRVNVFTPMLLTKYAIRNMLLHNTKGGIVHISSVSAHTGYKGLAMYASTKGALEAFSKNTAREWGAKGIRSNCVVPGFMETDMSSELTEEQRQKIYRRTSLKKATEISSVVETVVFLLLEKSSSITGQIIAVDSGTI